MLFVTRSVCGVLVVVAALGLACNPPTQPQNNVIPPPSTPPPPPTVTRVTVSGPTTATEIGESRQLTATALYSDNTTKDVTELTKWISGDDRYLTVSPSGVFTVVAFGRTYIAGTYSSRSGSVTIKATPAGTFVITGFVREPGQGPLAGVTITETASGRSATSNSDGSFSLAPMTSLSAHYVAEKDGYERVDMNGTEESLDVPLQRIIRLTAGETVTPMPLAPHDLSFAVGPTTCYDCRLVRLSVPAAGTVRVRITWSGMSSAVNLLVAGQTFAGASNVVTADLALTPGEMLMYVGATSPNVITQHTNFKIETTLQ